MTVRCYRSSLAKSKLQVRQVASKLQVFYFFILFKSMFQKCLLEFWLKFQVSSLRLENFEHAGAGGRLRNKMSSSDYKNTTHTNVQAQSLDNAFMRTFYLTLLTAFSILTAALLVE